MVRVGLALIWLQSCGVALAGAEQVPSIDRRIAELAFDYGHMPPGPYTLTVDWSERADRPRLRDVGLQELPQVVQIEVREVKNERDQFDVAVRASLRSLEADQLEEALQWIERILDHLPLDPYALGIRGRILAARGDCEAARADWQMAAVVLEHTANIAERRWEIDGDPRTAAARWREMAERLDCRP